MARLRISHFLLTALLLSCVVPSPAEAAICGNGRLNHGEGCDDGNNSTGDGCDGNCLTEIGWRCTGTAPSVCTNDDVCGNGVVESGETCDDGNLTAGDGCQPDCEVQPGYGCTGEPSICLPPGNLPVGECGDGVVNDGEECDDGNLAAGDGCEADCTTTSGYECVGEPSVCSNTTGECGDGSVDIGEECDDADTSSGDGCDDECFVEAGFECTGVPSICTESDCGNGMIDSGEDCDGGPCCIDCAFATSSRTCRPAVGECDAPESCSGFSADCPADILEASDTVCRASSGICDAVERCTGASPTCPADLLSPGTTVCRPAVSDACDVAETCTGSSDECPADQLIGCPDTDGIDCIHPACDPSGQCTTRDDCVEVCRDARFWGTRATAGKDRIAAIDLVLEETGSIEVCGQTVDDAADLGGLDSALEGLCVRPQGNEERKLYRALLATAVNCLLSEGGTCDEILSRFTDVSFSDCDALCEGDSLPDGPTMEECIAQLECFNGGGQLVDGRCATGTCEFDPEQLCGGDFGSCSGTVNGGALTYGADRGKGRGKGHGPNHIEGLEEDDGETEEEECVAFDDNCADARLCQNSDAEVRLCGRRLVPRNQKACREASSNQCTIDRCN